MGIDLLVVGSRSYGPVLRTMLGSVTAELTRSAPCPLLVFPRGSGRHHVRPGSQPRDPPRPSAPG
jgi:hypothetical protein